MKVSASRFPVVLFSRCLVCTVTVTLLVVQTVPAQVVNIPDSNLRQLVTETLQLPDGTPITQQEMLRLEFLDAAGDRGITDLTGLQYATNLWGLDLYHNPIVNISSLAYLTKLEGFNLWGCQVVDLSPLRNLTNLRSVILGNNQISDITPLANLVHLTNLGLDNNQIRDISPLANLILLEELRLNANEITDVTPLAGLTNLKKLYLADNPIHNFSPLAELEGIELDLEIDLNRLDELNVVVEVPDPNLRQAIRESLSLPKAIPLTQQQMLRLTSLDAGGDRGIADLTGLQYATNLLGLDLYHNPIVDIRPLAHLTKLEGFNLWGCRIVDLSPLHDLKNLKTIILGNNQISDITPLANLVQLTNLGLDNNQIRDISPLVNLVNLERLDIRDNLVADVSPLNRLSLIEFEYDEVCDTKLFLPSVRERIESRSFPSVFQAWDNIVGLDRLTWDQRVALHDLHWSPFFGLHWRRTPTEPTHGVATSLAGDLANAREVRQRRLDQNPNMVFLVEVRIHGHFTEEEYPPGSDFWLRDAQNQILRDRDGQYLINFLKPEVQELLAKRMIAVERCGVFDGVMIDGFFLNGTGFVDRYLYPVTNEEIMSATEQILRTVRSQVRDDFLILINANRSKATRYATYVNGTFMETGKDYPGGYTHKGLAEIDNTLLWSEQNFRSPQINCLEGYGIGMEAPDSLCPSP